MWGNKTIKYIRRLVLMALSVAFLSFAFFAFNMPEVVAASDPDATKADVLSQLGEAVKQVNADIQARKNQIEIQVSDDIQSLLDSLNPNRVKTASVFSRYFSDCWFCGLFSVIFDAINELSYAVWEHTKFSFIVLLSLLGAFWLILRIANHIASLTPQSPEEFWTKISRVLFKMFCVSVILTTTIGEFIGTWIISPIVLGSAEFTTAIVESYGNVDSAFNEAAGDYNATSAYTGSNDIKGFNQTHTLGDSINPIERQAAMNYEGATEVKDKLKAAASGVPYSQAELKQMQDELLRSVLGNNTNVEQYFLDCSDNMEALAEQARLEAEAMGNVAATDGALNTEAKVAFLCMLETMNQEISFGMSLGEALSNYGLTAGRWFFLPIPDIPVILAGALIWMVCFLLMFAFVAKLLDACFRLGVLCTILPLLLICFVFPSTEEYAKYGFKQLIHVVFVFIVMSIVLALAILLVMQAFQIGRPDVSEQYDIRTLFYLGQMSELHKQLNLSGRSFLGAIACFFFALTSIKMVDGIAGQFTQVSSQIGGGGIGTIGGDHAMSTIAKSASNVGQGGGNLAKAGAKKGFNGAKSKLGAVKK